MKFKDKSFIVITGYAQSLKSFDAAFHSVNQIS